MSPPPLLIYRKKNEQPVTTAHLEDEWFEFKGSQWKLFWEHSSLKLKLELVSSEVAEKVDDICLYCATDVNFGCQWLKEGADIQIPNPFHRESLIYLKKQSKYECNVSNQFHCTDYSDLITVSATVKLVMLKCTLNTIDEVKIPPSALGNELGGLLTFETGEKKNKFTDVTFSITTNESASPLTFYAHKAVLAARSPVFAKMFEHNLQESATNSVMLSDVDPEVFKELLTYIYTGKAPHIQALASSLLNTAEKYQLGHLKVMCERQMSYGLAVKNAAETLVLAHTYRADQLKKNALKFIIKHRNEVRETKDWEKVHNMCELLEELLDTALAAKTI